MKKPGDGLQDGMLRHYLEQAPFQDRNIEAKLEREPFSIQDHINRKRSKDIVKLDRLIAKTTKLRVVKP